MEKIAFLEKKISLTPKDINRIKNSKVDDIILSKLKENIESKCSEHGFVIPGTIKLISRSLGYYEAARFTGDAVYYVKAEANVIYPVDGIKVVAEVIRKNKMGLYAIYKDAIRIQVPRDLHIGDENFENVQIGDKIEVEIKRSKFQINDLFILSSGIFIKNVTNDISNKTMNASILQSRKPDIELLDETTNALKSIKEVSEEIDEGPDEEDVQNEGVQNDESSVEEESDNGDVKGKDDDQDDDQNEEEAF